MNFAAPPEDWYRTFFIAPFNDLWDRVVPLAATERESAFLIEQLELGSGAAILDVPCGSGRVSVALAAAGFHVTGVDLSIDALARARARNKAANTAVTFVHADMRELPWTESFDAAVCLGNSFGYLPHAGMMEFVRALGGTLRRGARAMVHSGMCAESILPALNMDQTYDFGDMTFEIHHQYDVRGSRLDTEFVLTQGENVWRQLGSQAVYTAAEVVRLLEGAGLRVEALFGDADGKPYALGDGELYLLAQATKM